MEKLIKGSLIIVLSLSVLAGCTQKLEQKTTPQADIDNVLNIETEEPMPPTANDDLRAMDVEIGEIVTTYTDVTPAEANQMINSNPGLIIIDVSPNYDKGHLPSSINYYVGDGSLDNAIPTLDMDKVYLVYCHVDSASISGAQKLIDAGFMNVFRLEGNYAAWVEAGYEIEQ